MTKNDCFQPKFIDRGIVLLYTYAQVWKYKKAFLPGGILMTRQEAYVAELSQLLFYMTPWDKAEDRKSVV